MANLYTQADVDNLVRLARAAEASRYDPGENLTGLSDAEFIARLFRSPLYVIEGNVPAQPDSLEDGGQAMIIQLDDELPGILGGDPQMFVRLQSWHEGAKKTDTDSHPRLRSLLGRRVRITVEDLGEHQ